MPIAQLNVSGHILTVEVAHTEAARSQGLMFRESIGVNDGMLFIFPQPGNFSMWMMNTDIPLSVAFLDEKGAILNIENMAPRTTTRIVRLELQNMLSKPISAGLRRKK